MPAQTDIVELYIGYFNRAPDPEGLQYWEGRYNDGMALSEIANSFSVQTEATSTYPFLANPDSTSPDAFITSVYQNLFGRDPDASGLSYWHDQIVGGKPVGSAILDIISGAQGDDAIKVADQVAVSEYYVSELNEHDKAWSSESAHYVISDVDQTPESVVEGDARVDAYVSGANPPGSGGSGSGGTLGDALEDIGNIVHDATTLDVAGLPGDVLDLGGDLLGGILGAGGSGSILNVLGFESGKTTIDLGGLGFGPITEIASLGDVATVSLGDVFDQGPLVRAVVGGQSLLLVDVNHDNIFEAGHDLEILGVANALPSDFLV